MTQKDSKWHDRLLRPLMSKRQRQRMNAKHIAWLDRDFFTQAHAAHGSVTGIPDQRVFFLQAALRALEPVEGDVAECGVRHGRSTAPLDWLIEGAFGSGRAAAIRPGAGRGALAFEREGSWSEDELLELGLLYQLAMGVASAGVLSDVC